MHNTNKIVKKIIIAFIFITSFLSHNNIIADTNSFFNKCNHIVTIHDEAPSNSAQSSHTK